jgi:hypothetical protein
MRKEGREGGKEGGEKRKEKGRKEEKLHSDHSPLQNESFYLWGK